jgi:putative DNA primase/helicase
MSMDFTIPPEERSRADIDTLGAMLQACAKSWVPSLLPQGQKFGRTWRAGDAHGGRGFSLAVEIEGPRAGLWIDWAGGEEDHGGPIKLIQKIKGTTWPEAINIARQIVGMPDDYVPDLKGWTMAKHRIEQFRLEESKRKHVEKIVSECLSIHGTYAEAYLRNRGLQPPYSPDILFHPWLYHVASESHWPALVGIIRSTAGEVRGVHRIYVTPQGTKAPITPAKVMLGIGENAIRGSSVRLTPFVDDTLATCEGIETGYAVRSLGWPGAIWAGLSTSGIVNLEVPCSVRKLVIFRDAGEPGRIAAVNKALAEEQRGIECVIVAPQGDDDFNKDLLVKLGINRA